MAAESGIDAVFSELRAIDQQMSALPESAYQERLALKQRRRELHAQASELGHGARSAEAVRRELTRLRELRRAILDRHLSVGHVGGGNGPGGGGIEPRYVFDVNTAIDAGWDRAGIEQRIRELESDLAHLRAD